MHVVGADVGRFARPGTRAVVRQKFDAAGEARMAGTRRSRPPRARSVVSVKADLRDTFVARGPA